MGDLSAIGDYSYFAICIVSAYALVLIVWRRSNRSNDPRFRDGDLNLRPMVKIFCLIIFAIITVFLIAEMGLALQFQFPATKREISSAFAG